MLPIALLTRNQNLLTLRSVFYQLALLPAFLHVYIFIMESLLFDRKRTQRIFNIKAEEVNAVKPWAFNQGFYNLFLAVGIFTGFYLTQSTETLAQGRILIMFCLFSIMAAGLVLLGSAPKKMWRGAVIQVVPAAIALFPFFIS